MADQFKATLFAVPGGRFKLVPVKSPVPIIEIELGSTLFDELPLPLRAAARSAFRAISAPKALGDVTVHIS